MRFKKRCLSVVLASIWFGSAWASGGGDPFYRFYVPVVQSETEYGSMTHGAPYANSSMRNLLVWYWHLTGQQVKPDAVATVMDNYSFAYYGSDSLPEKDWPKTRNQLAKHLGLPTIEGEVKASITADMYSESLNCYPDAFSNAARVAEARLEKYQKDKEALAVWLQNQDLVFQTCSSLGAKVFEQWKALPKEAPTWLVHDNAYQHAAAQFYLNNYDEAMKEFVAIGNTPDSPWVGLAQYMQLRVTVRGLGGDHMSSLSKAEVQARIEPALKLANDLLKNPALKMYYDSIARLVAALKTRTLKRMERLMAIAPVLEKAPVNAEAMREFEGNYRQFLLDYQWGEDDARLDGQVQPPDFLDWLVTMRGLSGNDYSTLFEKDKQEDVANHGYEQWQKKKTQPWLFAAAAQMSVQDKRYSEIVKDLEKIDAKQVGFFAAQLYLIRHAAFHQQTKQVRQLGLPLWKQAKNMNPTDRNILASLLLPTSQNEDEFLMWAKRVEIVREDPENPENKEPAKSVFDVWDEDAKAVYNAYLPVRVQARVLKKAKLSNADKLSLYEVIWSRAIRTDQLHVAREAAAQILALRSASEAPMKKSTKANLEKMSKLSNKADVGRMILERLTAEEDKMEDFRESDLYRYSGEVGNDFSKNRMSEQSTSNKENYGEASRCQYRRAYFDAQNQLFVQSLQESLIIESPVWLSNEDRKQASEEWAVLSKLDPLAIEHFKTIYAYEKTHANDPIVPHALYIAIRMTRYECKSPGLGKWSKEAFTHLKKQYPNSEWAKSTKYWYK